MRAETRGIARSGLWATKPHAVLLLSSHFGCHDLSRGWFSEPFLVRSRFLLFNAGTYCSGTCESNLLAVRRVSTTSPQQQYLRRIAGFVTPGFLIPRPLEHPFANPSLTFRDSAIRLERTKCHLEVYTTWVVINTHLGVWRTRYLYFFIDDTKSMNLQC